MTWPLCFSHGVWVPNESFQLCYLIKVSTLRRSIKRINLTKNISLSAIGSSSCLLICPKNVLWGGTLGRVLYNIVWMAPPGVVLWDKPHRRTFLKETIKMYRFLASEYLPTGWGELTPQPQGLYRSHGGKMGSSGGVRKPREPGRQRRVGAVNHFVFD